MAASTTHLLTVLQQFVRRSVWIAPRRCAAPAGKRSNAMMKSAASSLSNDDLANLAAYYSSLK
jgi:hypothetical protein